jgi:peptidoglycan/xylan/chitin deacetylase (PgdA/CDA1 family)
MQVSLTFDIEMCTNFPYWSDVWDHRKGAIDEQTRLHIGKLAHVAEELGARFQWFVLGAAVEADDIEYLQRLVADGHAVGNHTYHHVNVKAQRFEDLQVVYNREPARLQGAATPHDVTADEVSVTSDLIEHRLGVRPQGFRTPGGFGNGLQDAPAVQHLLNEHGFAYCSSHYDCPLPIEKPFEWSVMEEGVGESLRSLQPYRYPNGLPEIPMAGISDIHAYRVRDLDRGEFTRLLEHGVEVAARENLIFSILMHPAVQASRDPHCDTVKRLVDKTVSMGGEVVTNDEIAGRLS